MSATTTPITQFPVQVKKEIIFIAQSDEDLNYLNSKQKDEDFLCDLKEFGENIALDIFSVDGETL